MITLPSAQSDWVISYSSFPQNVGIGQNFLYVSTKIDNIANPTNSSSGFINRPTFIYCINQPAWDDFSSTDVDGDSLSYHIIPIEDNDTLCPHAPFINPVPAFPSLQSQSSTPVSIDSTNGSLTFTPSTLGMSMVAVQVNEHKNGVMINSTTIQHAVFLVTGCTITGLGEPISNTMQVLPNPAGDFIRINLATPEEIFFAEAVDVSGKSYLLELLPSSAGSWNADVSALAPGIYFIKAAGATSVYLGKMLKE
jgi:hypothetical protein